jgi:hypothetical protein
LPFIALLLAFALVNSINYIQPRRCSLLLCDLLFIAKASGLKLKLKVACCDFAAAVQG